MASLTSGCRMSSMCKWHLAAFAERPRAGDYLSSEDRRSESGGVSRHAYSPPCRRSLIVAGGTPIPPLRPAEVAPKCGYPDPGLISPGIDHHDGMTRNQSNEPNPSEAELFSARAHFKRNRPPSFVGLYKHRQTDGDGELVAIFEMEFWEDSLKMMGRLIRGWKTHGLFIVATTDPDEIILLEGGRERALSVRQLEALYAEYYAHFDDFVTTRTIRPFSAKYTGASRSSWPLGSTISRKTGIDQPAGLLNLPGWRTQVTSARAHETGRRRKSA